ncbi:MULTISPECIES: PilX N-terminal domain-containing pilus assembly protein [Aeromonas]|uniref:PilX N-terminal domain-containing pilus assembly protein n=1 Tax=Aeromonas TaxID=642 RepID=UPI001905C9F7|nr:PilX N-terminal domain-containing pilus assembly protein [Aeromonas caviae]QQM75757.1 hypothetical protein JH254_00200 [Aeromonas caviae]QQV20856.1 hypothetical protein JJJ22_07710 [Aeromonas caviae]
MKRHAGFTTFTVTLLLILILVGISLLVGKLMVADRKISVNEVQYRQALALAELGIADGMGRVSIDPAWRSSSGISVSAAQGTYLLKATSAAAVTVDTLEVTPVVLRAEATLADGLGKAEVQVQVAGYSLMADSKAVPLMGLGIEIGGNFDIVANPNGGGPGVPLSVWSKEPVTGNGDWKTCHLGDFSGGCGAALSDSKNIGPDIKANDPTFPPDLLWYLFGEPDTAEGWANMIDKAVAAPPDSSCGSLGPASTGIYIVQGNCVLPDVTGSASAPVVLIVKDGDLTLNADKDFNGIIFVYSSTDPSPYDVKATGNATINGALILNTPPKNLNGTFDLIYDQTVLSSIQNGVSFQATKMVPGSWRDW